MLSIDESIANAGNVAIRVRHFYTIVFFLNRFISFDSGKAQFRKRKSFPDAVNIRFFVMFMCVSVQTGEREQENRFFFFGFSPEGKLFSFSCLHYIYTYHRKSINHVRHTCKYSHEYFMIFLSPFHSSR